MQCWVKSDSDPGSGFCPAAIGSAYNRINPTHLSGATLVGQDVGAEDEGIAGSSGATGERERGSRKSPDFQEHPQPKNGRTTCRTMLSFVIGAHGVSRARAYRAITYRMWE